MKHIINILPTDNPLVVGIRKGQASPLNQVWDVFLPDVGCGGITRLQTIGVFTGITEAIGYDNKISSFFVSDGNYSDDAIYTIGEYFETLPMADKSRISFPYEVLTREVEF